MMIDKRYWMCGLWLWSSWLAAQLPSVQSEALIFPLQDKHVHGSSLVELPNGDMLAVWFEGSGERTADDVQLKGARRVSGSQHWSAPFAMADTPNLPDCNPVLFLNAAQELFLVWIAVPAHRWEQSILRVRISDDYLRPGPPRWRWQDNILLNVGDAFAEELERKWKQLPPSTAGWGGYAPRYDDQIIAAGKDPVKRSFGWMTRIKPLLLPGRLLLPLYSDGFNLSMLAISEDDGKTWRPSLPIVGRGPIQPALVQQRDGQILALMRDSGDEPARVQRSWSKDGGETWSAAEKTTIPNTASVELLRLQDGRWAFVGNDVDDGRYRLSLYLSADEGQTWPWKMPLEETTPGKGNFSYPCLVQARNGQLHVSYSYHLDATHKTIKHLVLGW